MQRIFIKPNGKKAAILQGQSDLIMPEWVECEKKDDGTYAQNYNADGSINWDVENNSICKSARRCKINKLDLACVNEITNTLFESDSLGITHSYDCTEKAQTNLALIGLSGVGGFIYAHTQPKFVYEYHTDEQCKVLAADMSLHIKNCRQKFADKMALVNAIAGNSQSDIDAIKAIEW